MEKKKFPSWVVTQQFLKYSGEELIWLRWIIPISFEFELLSVYRKELLDDVYGLYIFSFKPFSKRSNCLILVVDGGSLQEPKNTTHLPLVSNLITISTMNYVMSHTLRKSFNKTFHFVKTIGQKDWTWVRIVSSPFIVVPEFFSKEKSCYKLSHFYSYNNFDKVHVRFHVRFPGPVKHPLLR